jgi:glutaredoxin 3
MKIIAYLKTGCPWCIEMKKFFEDNNIDYIEKNVTENTDFMDEMIELSGQFKAPTVVIDGVVYADTDTEEIKKVLEL